MKPKMGSLWFRKTKGKLQDEFPLKSLPENNLARQNNNLDILVEVVDAVDEALVVVTEENKEDKTQSLNTLIKRSDSINVSSRNGIESDSSGPIGGYSARD